jgi:hypothetical protein
MAESESPTMDRTRFMLCSESGGGGGGGEDPAAFTARVFAIRLGGASDGTGEGKWCGLRCRVSSDGRGRRDALTWLGIMSRNCRRRSTAPRIVDLSRPWMRKYSSRGSAVVDDPQVSSRIAMISCVPSANLSRKASVAVCIILTCASAATMSATVCVESGVSYFTSL